MSSGLEEATPAKSLPEEVAKLANAQQQVVQGRGGGQGRVDVEAVPLTGDGPPGDALTSVEGSPHCRPQLIQHLSMAMVGAAGLRFAQHGSR